MNIELSMDNILVLCGFAGAFANVMWARSVSLHNKISEQRSDALQKSNDALKVELDDLRDCVYDTREKYLTREEFKETTTVIMGKLDRITELLAQKPDRDFCDVKHKRILEQ